MAKLPFEEKKEELADWDPEVPQEKDEDLDRPPVDPRRRRRLILWLVLLASLAVLAFIIHRQFFQDPNPLGLVPELPASPVMNLQGIEVSTLGPLEGPYLLLEALSGRRVELGNLQRRVERFDLIGLSDHDYPDPALDESKLSDDQRSQRQQWLASLEQVRRQAIAELCGEKFVYLIRMSPPSPDQPSLVYLFQPLGSATDAQGLPNGQARLLNAWLLREGKASLLLEEDHPLFDRMLDCQLAALIAADRARQAGRDDPSLWGRLNLVFPLSPRFQSRMNQLTPLVN